jgi:hypothetical protein
MNHVPKSAVKDLVIAHNHNSPCEK